MEGSGRRRGFKQKNTKLKLRIYIIITGCNKVTGMQRPQKMRFVSLTRVLIRGFLGVHLALEERRKPFC